MARHRSVALESVKQIEWTDVIWNPVTGCTKISDGCTHCYAERLALRLHAMGMEQYRHGFSITMHERALHDPLTWKTMRRVFVNSMSDLFHTSVHTSFISTEGDGKWTAINEQQNFRAFTTQRHNRVT